MTTRNLALAKSLTYLTDDGLPNFASGSDIILTPDSDTGVISTAVTVGGQSATAVNNYSAIDSLPLSNLTAGSLSYVQSTGTFYYSNGSGWYKITTTNSAPIIVNGAETRYLLETDGTSTIVTLTAVDGDSTPLTWSYNITGGSLGNTATIIQDSSVFTITPSTDSADVGSFDITFSVSDGISIATDTASFTLVFEINAFLDGSSVTYTNNSVSLNGRTYGGNWSRNGMIYVSTGTDYSQIVKFNTPFNITDVLSNTRYNLGQIGGSSNSAESITFNNDGTRYFRTGGGIVEEISVDPPYSFSAETLIGNVSAPTMFGISFSTNGEYLFYITGGSINGGGDTVVRRKDLTTPFTLVGLSSNLSTYSQSFNPSALVIESFYAVWFTENGLFMYILGIDKVVKYQLSVGWDITTATYTNEFVTLPSPPNWTGANGFNHSLAFDSDYTQLLVTDRSYEKIYSYLL